jgi:hypothetical protein
MRAKILISVVFAAAGCSHTKSVTPEPEHYTITEHIVVPQADSDLQRDEHTLTYGAETLKVRYTDSQTSHSKPKSRQRNSQPYVVFRPRFVPSTSGGDEDSRLPSRAGAR